MFLPAKPLMWLCLPVSMTARDGPQMAGSQFLTFVVCLAAMDGGAIPGTPDCVGAQGPAGLARRLGTLQHMGRINGNGTKGAEAGEPAAVVELVCSEFVRKAKKGNRRHRRVLLPPGIRYTN